jgi:hypothetical protein
MESLEFSLLMVSTQGAVREAQLLFYDVIQLMGMQLRLWVALERLTSAVVSLESGNENLKWLVFWFCKEGDLEWQRKAYQMVALAGTFQSLVHGDEFVFGRRGDEGWQYIVAVLDRRETWRRVL